MEKDRDRPTLERALPDALDLRWSVPTALRVPLDQSVVRAPVSRQLREAGSFPQSASTSAKSARQCATSALSSAELTVNALGILLHSVSRSGAP